MEPQPPDLTARITLLHHELLAAWNRRDAAASAAKADAGEILIPEPVRHLLSGKSYVYADRGETVLKGFEDAVRLYEVRWRE